MSRPEHGLPRASTWAISGIWFAASMLVLVGVFQILGGLAAIINSDFFVVGAHYTYHLDTTAWGWINLIVGVLVLLTGWALFAGRTWASVVALVMALISAIQNFFLIAYYPWWALLVIALDVWVIWALTRPGAVAEA
jgi:hypothetical protein